MDQGKARIVRLRRGFPLPCSAAVLLAVLAPFDLLSLHAANCPPITFGPVPIPTKSVPQISFNGYPNSVAAADFDRDRNLDIVYCSAIAVELLKGNGLGDFGPAINAVSGGYASVAVADLNNDGNPDLVLGTATVNVRVAIGNGDGTFKSPVSYSANPGGLGQAQIVTAADLDGNGTPDIATILQGANLIGILPGRVDGTGTFNNATTSAVTAPSGGLVAGDFNGDGFIDLATFSSLTNFAVLSNKGNGTFNAQTNSSTGLTGLNLTSLRALDLDADGVLDLTALSTGVPKRFIAMKGRGDGTFAVSSVQTNSATTVYSTALADVTGDGRPDVLIASFTTLTVLENLGGGTFADALAFSATSVGSVISGDFNEDGRPDVVLFGGDAKARIFLNETEFLPAVPVVTWNRGVNTLRLVWYTNYPGYNLYYSQQLGGGAGWQLAPGSPSVIDCQYFYTISSSNPGFYRLIKQP